MKIVNTSDKPYKFTFDGRTYGPMLPNEVWDIDATLANHAIKKSEILDDEGQVIGNRVQRVDEVDPKTLRLKCPLAEIGECRGGLTFANLRELAEHMTTHKQPAITPIAKGEVRL